MNGMFESTTTYSHFRNDLKASLIFSAGKVGQSYAGSKQTPKGRKSNLAKKDGVTKIGNNVYFYTG